MQKLIALLSLALAVSGEAPYAASGWKPSGPAFELPQRGAETPQTYLPPPVDPRSPRTSVDAEDVSVQGLPVPEPMPQFRVSPVSGQQYAGPAFQKDLRGLDDKYRQAQYQLQQQRFRELARQQQQFYAMPSTTQTNRPSPVPRQFVPRTTAQPTQTPNEQRTTTESLNTGEVPDNQKTSADTKQEKVSVEITKQKIQEYPPELFLGPLAQVRAQRVRNPGQQFAQLIYQPSLQEINQKQSASPAFDGVANLGLVQSILAQNQQRSAALLAGREPNPHFILISSANQDLSQYQPLAQQYQLQPLLLPAQLNQFEQVENKKEPEVRDVEKDADDDVETTKENQPRFAGQPQFVPQQPQNVPQPFVPQEQQFVPHQQQFTPAQQPFVPQQQQFAPAQQPFVPQQQQFAPAQQPFVPQQQQFTPAQQPFVPQQQQFAPAQQQFVPQQEQVVPQQQQFAPQQQQFVPQQQQFTSQQQQSVTQQQQFVAQQQQFVPQQQQLAPQQQQFVPQQQQFVPQQQQFVVEQPQMYQPQEIQYQYQPQAQQLNYQPTNEDINMYYQQQQLLLQQQQQQLLVQQQQVVQRQNPQGIQSDIGDGQQNNLDQQDDTDDTESQNGGQVATAVATAFGDRSRPRVPIQYGAPLPTPQSTTENDDEEPTTTEAPVVAEASAVARGGRRKSAKLRTRRVRPIFGVDKSGHLVQLMQDQQ